MDAIFRTVQEDTRTERVNYATERWAVWTRFHGLILSAPAGYIQHYLEEVRAHGESRAQTRLERLIPALILEPQIRVLLHHELLHIYPREVMVQKVTNPGLMREAREGLLSVSITHDLDGTIKTLNINAQLSRVAPNSPEERYTINVGSSELNEITQLVIEYYVRGVGEWILDKYNTPQHIEEELLDLSDGDEESDDEGEDLDPAVAVYRQLRGDVGLERRDYDEREYYYPPAADTVEV